MGHSERVLYVEDDDDIREMLESFLTSEGYAVTSHRTAEEGLACLERHGCDLLLTDYVLPNEDAAWLLREARGRSLLVNVPVIVVSAEYKPPGIEGATLLKKPVKVETLLQAIDEALQEKRGIVPETEPDSALAPPELDLVLYVASPSHESEAAKRNLGRIVRALNSPRVRVVVHDIGEGGTPEALRALEDDRIVVVPTLVKRSPAPKVWIAGDLSKREKVTELLRSALDGARRLK